MKVVAISGVSGSGKTSVIMQLSEQLDCPYLLFDDYTDENTYPKDMKHWLKNGANVSEITTPKFVKALLNLTANANSDYVFIEEPFGRRRDSVSSLIDTVILLDQPMEVCLSRVMTRSIKKSSSDSLIFIPKYLSMYDDYFREIYIETTNQVRIDSDMIIQEVLSIESTTKLIANWLALSTSEATEI
ncbi:MAG: hypothetical protein HRU24_07680 [Gammaproteobacteria bacterium]|nr:hypothetical protein [Gammaproteobacteria bacterium]